MNKYRRIRRLKQSAHILGYNNLLSRLSIEIDTILESLIKKERQLTANLQQQQL